MFREKDDKGALSGLRVVDFGHYLAGPLAGMLLADQGADVLKIQPLNGPRMRSPANAALDRGKKILGLNLKDPEGISTAKDIVANADVLIENFRPGTMDRFGLGWANMSAQNPHLVYCSLPGYANDDTRKNVRAWEGVLGASTAVYFRGYMPPEREKATAIPPDKPYHTSVPISSSLAAFQAATAIMAAIYLRGREGTGQYIEIPLFDATFVALGTLLNRIRVPGSNLPSLLEMAAASAPPILVSPHHECSDGKWLDCAFTWFEGSGRRPFDAFIEAAGIRGWIESGLIDAETLAWREGAESALDEMFSSRPAAEWEKIANESGREATVCRSTKEWLSYSAARESQLVVEVDDPTYGLVSQPGAGVILSEAPVTLRARVESSGKFGPTERDRWRAWKKEDKRSTGMREEGRPPLGGVRVLDLTHILAGPQCGVALAELGADVISLYSPYRSGPGGGGERGKRSMVIDLSDVRSHDVFWRLAETSDAIITNFRPHKFDRRGIGPTEVLRRLPRMIYCSMTAYDSSGPLAEWPGYEFNAQAATGMQVRMGGHGRKPETQPVTINDNGTGLLAAFGVIVGLIHRDHTGFGTHVAASLTRTAGLAQVLFMHDADTDNVAEPTEPSLGFTAYQRIYEASDGYFYLGAAMKEDLAKIPEIAEASRLPGREADTFLVSRFATRDVAHWVAVLNTAGIGASRLATAAELADDSWCMQHGLIEVTECNLRATRGLTRVMGSGARLSASPVKRKLTAPRVGEHTREILGEIGLTAGEIDDLLVTNVVREWM